MNEVRDFEETESLNEDIFDCEYTSVDAVINEVTVFTGCKAVSYTHLPQVVVRGLL